MAGTMETMRVAGTVGGYPSEIDSTLKVRHVAPLLVNMSERSTDLLKYLGGVETFQYNNTKVEWVEDDPWNRRVTLAGAMTSGVTTMQITGAAHRFPVGTIFHNPNPNSAGVAHNEYVRVVGHVDADNVTVTREIAGGGSMSGETWATTDEIFVSGFSMHENDNWVFRPTSIFTMPYNLSQVHSLGVEETFRRMETAIYGLQGSDLDKQCADTVAEQFVLIEMEAAHGSRSAGSASVPSMLGGVKYYTTAANGSEVTDCAGAALTRKDIDDLLQTRYYEVGGDKMAKTFLVSAWGKRKISSFFSSAERLGPGAGQTAGVTVDRLNTDFGVVDVLLHNAVQKDEILVLRRENHKVGHHGALGRPQLRQLPPSSAGPRVQQAFYADLSMINSGPRAEGRIHNFSTTS